MKMFANAAVETNVSSEVVEFKTSKNSGKIFALLGSYLYSNKELCVLHELSSNASDAHTMVGKSDLPIKVTLPGTLDPNLRVRDYGPGLSNDDVIRFLTTYGESDKQDSNDFIGGLGIGSKSPASVTNTWKIVSHFNGVQTDYLVFINGDGVPTLTTIRSVPTTETGLEVVIPVNPSRFNTWRDVVGTAYEYYPVTPEVIGGNGYQVSITNAYPKTFDHDTCWINRKHNIYGRNNQLTVVSYNRKYVVDIEVCKREFKSATAKVILETGVGILFGIGELDLSISRETLQMTPKTIQAIENKLDSFFSHMKSDFEKKIGACSTEIEYKRAVRKIIGESASSNYVALIMSFVSGKYGIRSNSDLFRINLAEYTSDIMRDVRVYDGSVVRSIEKLGRTMRNSIMCRINTDYGVTPRKNTVISTIEIDSIDSVKYYISDCVDAYARVKFADHRAIIADANSVAYFNPEIATKFVNASTLPKKPRAARGSGKVDGDDVVYRIVGNSYKTIKADQLASKVAYVIVENLKSASIHNSDDKVIHLMVSGYDIVAVKKESDLFLDIPTVDEAIRAEIAAIEGIAGIETEIDAKIMHNLKYRFYVVHNLITFASSFNIRTPRVDSVWNKMLDMYVSGTKLKTDDHGKITKLFNLSKLMGETHPLEKVYDEKFNILTSFYESYKLVAGMFPNTVGVHSEAKEYSRICVAIVNELNV